ncbi:hypothetical protein ACIBI9_06245 [Nonomuraea sp. NPDC050451]|uniref:hypothetical protein n=1 Tax=Nonomuraea sp. NPDC050451 TaxID=3364364 RepID=UPI0037ADB4F3
MDSAPGSAEGLRLIVEDIEQALKELAGRGVEVTEPFHDATGAFHHAGGRERVSGAHPQRASHGSFAAFSDPDGNDWILQEITVRGLGR